MRGCGRSASRCRRSRQGFVHRVLDNAAFPPPIARRGHFMTRPSDEYIFVEDAGR